MRQPHPQKAPPHLSPHRPRPEPCLSVRLSKRYALVAPYDWYVVIAFHCEFTLTQIQRFRQVRRGFTLPDMLLSASGLMRITQSHVGPRLTVRGGRRSRRSNPVPASPPYGLLPASLTLAVA